MKNNKKQLILIPRHCGKSRLLLKEQLESLGIDVEQLIDIYKNIENKEE